MSSPALPRTLQALPLNRQEFAPFGDSLAVPADAAAKAINDGSAQRVDGLATLDLSGAGGAPCLALFRTAGPAHQAPWTLKTLERHALGSQTFVPLGKLHCLAVVTLADPQGAPDLGSLRAFIIQPGQGVTLRRGVWHHPLLTLGPGDVLVLERRGATEDCEIVQLAPGWQVLPPNSASDIP